MPMELVVVTTELVAVELVAMKLVAMTLLPSWMRMRP